MVAENNVSGTNWVATEDPIGVYEISELLNVEPTTVSSWRQRHNLPKPDKLVNKGATPLWKTSTILEWANATGRNRRNVSLDDVNVNSPSDNSLENYDIKELEWSE
tara:strand:+ start:2300 stop:2617 length:318 start_codon:yes stop_codon:yes gene_type:complete